jgi:hypothetical protein
MFLVIQFTSGFNGQPLSEEEKKLVQNWIVGAANFYMLPKEEQERQLARDVGAQASLKGRIALGPTLRSCSRSPEL